MAVVVPLLSRPVYPYVGVDRLVGLQPGTARRWINGYNRNGITYDPILRDAPQAADRVT